MILEREKVYNVGWTLIMVVAVYVNFTISTAVGLMFIIIASFLLWIWNVERAKYDLLLEQI